jgi:SagB-type dehydrogenase family enzyme
MKNHLLIIVAAIAALLLVLLVTRLERGMNMQPRTVPDPPEKIRILPHPSHESVTSVENALLRRHSTRSFRPDPLSLGEISQLLWAAQGVTHNRAFRTAPSAGALYPLETYVVAGTIKDLPPGTYRYLPEKHQLLQVLAGDIRGALCKASLGQEPVCEAPASIVFSAAFARTTGKYGKRGIRYGHMESGSAAQNVSLQAVSLGLATVVIGAFDDQEVSRVLSLPAGEEPMLIIPVGKGRD